MRASSKILEVDGLRAVAVLAVLFYHAGFPLPGGYVGVDVFFVISGFLITRLIVGEVADTGRFQFGNFYLRRARRLLPAILCTIGFASVGSFLLLSPAQLEAFGQSAVAAVFSLSNVHFWLQADYFDALAESKPLLHTWTLSVEEQFYLVWPLLLVIALARGARLCMSLLVSIVIISTVIAEFWLSVDPAAAFYLLPARAGELAIGALLVWLMPHTSRPPPPAMLEFMLVTGLALIVFAILTFNDDTRFPGLASLVPCLGAALVILGGRARYAGAVLRASIMVGIGRISYSIYLVHWPLMVLYGVYTYAEPSLAESWGLVVASIALGWLQWRQVEERYRYVREDSWSARRFAGGSTVAAALVLVPAAWAASDNGVPERIPTERISETNREIRLAQWRTYCSSLAPEKDETLFTCQNHRGKNADIVIWGDSHALHLVAGFSKWFPDHNIYLPHQSACVAQSGFAGYVRDFNSPETRQCVERNERMMEWLEAAPPTNVVISGAKRSSPETMAVATAEILERLDAAGHTAVVIADFIRPGIPLADCVATPRWLVPTLNLSERCSGDAAIADDELAYNESLAELIERVIPINDLQCPRGSCRFFDGDTLLFRDHHHLSIAGSKYFVGRLREDLPF